MGRGAGPKLNRCVCNVGWDGIVHNVCIWQSGATLKGWDFIQERILTHDEDMIADFADDIDTLLVFVSAQYLSL